MRKHRRIAAAILAAMVCISGAGMNRMPGIHIDGPSIMAAAATTIWDGTADTSWYDGEEAEMHISTAEEFAGFAKLLAGGTTMVGQKIILDKDIYLNDPAEMKTDGETAPANLWDIAGKTFSGTFDGGSHTIYGLYTQETVCLGSVSEGASISNLSIENAIIGSSVFGTNAGTLARVNVSAAATGQSILVNENQGTITECVTDGTLSNRADISGGLCLKNTGTIEKCTNNAMISVSHSAGGIAYQNDGQIGGCVNNGTISKDNPSSYLYGACVGGIFAISDINIAKVENCINNADLIIGIENGTVGYAGGICGKGARVEVFCNCVNNGNIQVTSASYVGGIAGEGGGFEQCGNNGTISSAGSGYTGGITGYLKSETLTVNKKGVVSYTDCEPRGLKYCYNKGDVSGKTAGGLVGGSSYSNCDITNSYNTGSISGLSNYSYAGGLGGSVSGTITSCYSAASSVTGEYAGALLGLGTVSSESSACYYLNSGASQAVGSTAGEYGTPKSAANMKKEAFVRSLGDAFVYNEGGYPILFWEAGIPIISLDKTAIVMNEYKQQETILSDTTYEGELLWTSSDETIATVDETGTVTAVGNGTCTITVEGGGAKASCEVTVAYAYYLSETQITMKPDLAKELKVYSKSNDEPTSLDVKYSSSNEDVAEVNKRGVVSANAPGVAEIHAEIGSMDLVCVVTVEGVKGDVNADGEFNVSDVVLLQKWLLADPTANLNNWKAADCYEDDRLDVFDLCLMKRELLRK